MTVQTKEIAKAGKYLTFALGNEGYGIAIINVKEIIGYQDVTQVPQVPPEVKGVINLRGEVVPVIDLRLRFGLQPKEITEETCILVVETGTDNQIVSVGIMVDNVSEVQDIVQEQIEPSPSFGCSTEVGFIIGMAKVGKTVKILLDIDKVLDGCDLSAVVK